MHNYLPDNEIEKVENFILQQVNKAVREDEIVRQLMAKWAINGGVAQALVDKVKRGGNTRRNRKEIELNVFSEDGTKDIIFGALWCFGGLYITFNTYALASEQGGRYVVAWGAIVFGALQFLKGLISVLLTKLKNNRKDPELAVGSLDKEPMSFRAFLDSSKYSIFILFSAFFFLFFYGNSRDITHQDIDSGSSDIQINKNTPSSDVPPSQGTTHPTHTNTTTSQKEAGDGLAPQESAKKMYDRGWNYYNGMGVSRDLKEAEYWYRKAAEQGDANAQFNLGRMYAEGQGVQQDNEMAEKWWRMAAEQGMYMAQLSIDKMHEREVKPKNNNMETDQPNQNTESKPSKNVESWDRRNINSSINLDREKPKTNEIESTTIENCNGISTVYFPDGSRLKATFKDCQFVNNHCLYASKGNSYSGDCTYKNGLLTIKTVSGVFELGIELRQVPR